MGVGEIGFDGFIGGRGCMGAVPSEAMATWRHGLAAIRGRQRPEGGWARWAAKSTVGLFSSFPFFSEIASSLLFATEFQEKERIERGGKV
jgi:hypothetical protein